MRSWASSIAGPDGVDPAQDGFLPFAVVFVPGLTASAVPCTDHISSDEVPH